MSEYIKKEDAIEYLNDLFGEMCHVSFGDVLQSINSLQTYSFSDSAENKGEWISVSERLPEEDTKVYLACCDDGYVSAIMYSSGKWLIAGSNIVAWMPLPEPYKAESEEV